MKQAIVVALVACAALAAVGISAHGVGEREFAAEQRQLYTVATAHLDTQWRWTIQTTIDEYIPATLHDNFELFEKYPNYTFSFEGAFRYMLMKEYYPEAYEQLKRYIAGGRWKVAGSWVDAVDVNVPSPESLIRHTLYGNGFFRSEFGVTSRDVYLPDCFGFGFALPSVAAHCGLIGFSTQKLTWGSSVGIPFDIGLWEGVDGSRLVAAVNPGEYVAKLASDQSADSIWVARAEQQGKTSGVYAAFRYFGTGDRGGAPTDESVAWLERSMNGGGPLRVRSVASDQLARDLTAGLGASLPSRSDANQAGGPSATLATEHEAGLAAGLRSEVFEQADSDPVAARLNRLPRYRGELLMTDHGVGCYTSQSAMKRWNRKNERLADAAERAAVAAYWLGGATYPREALRAAWIRFLWHQFHDDLTGTSIPEAYVFSWNDEVISLNQFAAVLGDGVGAVGRALDTNAQGVPLIVFNPLSIRRQDIVEAHVTFSGGAPEAIRVYGPDGVEVPSQIVESAWGAAVGSSEGAKAGPEGGIAPGPEGGIAPGHMGEGADPSAGGFAGGSAGESVRVVFLASVPSVGFAVYDVRPAEAPCSLGTGLSVSIAGVENERYRVRLDEYGDIASIFDKIEERELIAAPLQLQLLEDSPRDWAAWEIDYDDITTSPRTVVGKPVRLRVVEKGPARVAVEVMRKAEGSTFRQTISLAAGDAGNHIPVDLRMDWRTRRTLLKAAFPLAVTNSEATYDLRLGTVRRGTNRQELYEVPAQQWADLTDESGTYGVALLSDCRYGWDKPDDQTLRLTLLHTPEVNENWGWIEDQKTQDLGRHRLRYAIHGHRGDWKAGGVSWVADRLNQPLLAFQVPKHNGNLGREFSLLDVRTRHGDPHFPVAVRAIKLAEETDEIVVRVQELNGAPVEDVRVAFAGPVIAAREINGAEEPVAKAVAVERGALKISLSPYQPRAFAVRLGDPPVRLNPPAAQSLELPYNLDGISLDRDRTDGDFDGAGHTLPGELLPDTLIREGIPFQIGPQRHGHLNVLACRGQKLSLPEGDFNRLYLLAAAVEGGRAAEFVVEGTEPGRQAFNVWIQDYAEPVAQWDSRIADGELIDDPALITPAHINRDPVAWVGTHRHDAQGQDEAYTLTHLFKYQISLPPGARSLRLPDDGHVRVLAISVARNENDASLPAQPLYDECTHSLATIHAPRREFVDSVQVVLSSPNPWAVIRYTLDGTDPTDRSSHYGDPLTLAATTTVKARAFAEGLDESFVAEAKFTRLTPREPQALSRKRPGLECCYYEGEWTRLPAFNSLAPHRSSTETRVGLPDYAREEDFALAFSGHIEAPRDGLYTFHLWSDDGSALYVGGDKVIDNDGLHGNQARRANVALKKGMHPIRVIFFQHLGGSALDLQIEGPRINLQSVPAEWLFHEGE